MLLSKLLLLMFTEANMTLRISLKVRFKVIPIFDLDLFETTLIWASLTQRYTRVATLA